MLRFFEPQRSASKASLYDLRPPDVQSPVRRARQVLLAACVSLTVLALQLFMAPAVLAGGGGGATISGAIEPAQALADEIALALSGAFGIAIGIIAFAVVGMLIMFARSTGRAIGSFAKVVLGLVILFGGAVMVGSIQTTGAVL